MVFKTSEIAVSGCFNGPAGFRTEMAKHRLPIRLREPPSNRKTYEPKTGSRSTGTRTALHVIRLSGLWLDLTAWGWTAPPCSHLM